MGGSLAREETGLKEMVQREGGSAPSVSVNASPPEWPINSNYGKEATITRLRGSILNPRTLYSQALFPCLSISLSLFFIPFLFHFFFLPLFLSHFPSFSPISFSLFFLFLFFSLAPLILRPLEEISSPSFQYRRDPARSQCSSNSQDTLPVAIDFVSLPKDEGPAIYGSIVQFLLGFHGDGLSEGEGVSLSRLSRLSPYLFSPFYPSRSLLLFPREISHVTRDPLRRV